MTSGLELLFLFPLKDFAPHYINHIEKYEKLNLRISIFNNISVLTLTDIGAI